MRRPACPLAFVLGILTACGDPPCPPRQPAALPAEFDERYVARLDSLDLALAGLAALPARPDSAAAQEAFRRVRTAYKRVEYLLELEDPIRAMRLNSPPVPVVDEDDLSNVIEPQGLQVLEAVLYPRPAPEFAQVVRREIPDLRRVIQFTRKDSAYRVRRTWWVPFQAARMGLARVTTLGLAGFDATVSGEAIRESAVALEGIREGLDAYRAEMLRCDPEGWDALQRSLAAGVAALSADPSFADFDRFGFIVRFVGPIAEAMSRLQRSLRIPEPDEPNPWSPGATNVYAAGAIAAAWFAPDYAPAPTPALIDLGRRLFFDTRLSGHGRRSCATCHQPALAFTDGRRVASLDPGPGPDRNTPTLLNAGFQRAQFADQRSPFLEFQFEEVMGSAREMALPPAAAAHRLSGDSTLARDFAATLGRPVDEALTGQTLSIAVAAYVRSLEALDSRFDRAIRGDTGAATASERRGFNLFMGKAACGTCHFAPLFGGTLPPAYVQSEPEVIGVPATAPAVRGVAVDDDPGMFAVTRAPLHRNAFKTPTVRNVALTAPYMHNGVFETLEEVVDFYDRGGGNGLGMGLPNQTLPVEPLELSEREKQDLVDFMRALTDSAFRRAPEAQPPALSAGR